MPVHLLNKAFHLIQLIICGPHFWSYLCAQFYRNLVVQTEIIVFCEFFELKFQVSSDTLSRNFYTSRHLLKFLVEKKFRFIVASNGCITLTDLWFRCKC